MTKKEVANYERMLDDVRRQADETEVKLGSVDPKEWHKDNYAAKLLNEMHTIAENLGYYVWRGMSGNYHIEKR